MASPKPEKLEDDFRELLEQASDKRSRNYIVNLYPWHCRESLKYLARHAFVYVRKNDTQRNAGPVKIVAHAFLDYLFNEETITHFKNYLGAMGSLQILLAKSPLLGGNENTPALNLILPTPLVKGHGVA